MVDITLPGGTVVKAEIDGAKIPMVAVVGAPGPGSNLPTAAFVVGQIKMTGAAVAIAAVSTPLSNGVIVKAKATNAGPIFIGGATVNTTYDGTGNGYPLGAGEAMSFAITDLAALYAIGTNNDVLSFGGN